MIIIKIDSCDIAKTYCECGRFIYELKDGWLSFPKGVNVNSNGKIFKVKCKCGLMTEINFK